MRPHDYPIPAAPATHSLRQVLRELIGRDGPVPFSRFMDCALYHPQLGYYARPPRPIGRGGDFFTSVSTGPLFGELLARRCLRQWHQTHHPEPWRVIELGAHDGTLAHDVLSAIARLDPQALAALEYAIPEPLPALQLAQRQTLAPFLPHVRFANSPDELAQQPLPGVAIANELLDALPCHVVQWSGGHWLECLVNHGPHGFFWQSAPASDELLEEHLARLDPCGPFPDNYRSEVRSGYRELLFPLCQALDRGLMIFIDYGFARPEYYHPERSAGTLRTYAQHHAGDDPLASPGECDITAHVDFTAVAEAAIALGGRPVAFRSQGSWLIHEARDWLASHDGTPNPPWLNAFHTLTHPAHLGARFHVLELSWNPALTPADPLALARQLALPPAQLHACLTPPAP